MKYSLLLIPFLCLTLVSQAQVIKTVNISAGRLCSVINSTERNKITNLTITGTIDARDFRTMRDSLPQLVAVDLSSSKIVAYTSIADQRNDGTNISKIWDWSKGDETESVVSNCSAGYNFAIDEIPVFAFRDKSQISLLILPGTATSISDKAFEFCRGLTSITIPEKLTQIGNSAFCDCSSLKTIVAKSATPIDLSKKTDVFKGVDKNACTLFVPVGSKGKYEAATGWKEFKKIVEK